MVLLFLKTICVLLVIAVIASSSFSQATSPLTIEPSGDGVAAILDDVNRQAQATDNPIILVARLGDGETLRKWNLRRLYNVATQLSGVKSVIKTEGDKISGKGRVEIHLDGKLIYSLIAHRNTDLAVDCCENFTSFYPYYHPTKNNQSSQKPEEILTEDSPNVAYAVPEMSESTGARMAELNHQLETSTKPFILVSHLGDGEHSLLLRKQRLKNVLSGIWTEPKGGILLTQGERVSGLGRVDCYVDGIRSLTLMTEQNEGFILSCCNLSDDDPRPARFKRKLKLRLTKEKALSGKPHKK